MFRITPYLLVVVLSALSGCMHADGNPNAPSAQTPLRGTEWSLLEINDKAVPASGSRRPTLLLAAEGGRASGFAGCNQFSAAYTATSDTLQVTSIAMTRMFCAETMELESRYVGALETTRKYRLNNNRLELLNDRDVILALLEKR